MKLSILLCLAAAVVASADPWRPRAGRGAYKRDAAAVSEPFQKSPYVAKRDPGPGPDAEAFHVRPGNPIYTYVAKRDAEPEPEPEAEAFHVRPGNPIYTYVAKREAEPEPEPEAKPWRPRPGRGAY
ncbi:hypothetical protein BGX38DRAFT_533200 [Terfezia claveryi]|nr:hypothetical protein BGX38DRAFT_533200 [Terfezia claveryi]